MELMNAILLKLDRYDMSMNRPIWGGEILVCYNSHLGSLEILEGSIGVAVFRSCETMSNLDCSWKY